MKTANRITDSLSERCVREALAIIEDSGVESLSLREVARRLGVSHQAPYKHFPDRDHLLAEIVSRCFSNFARSLDGRHKRDQPRDDLAEMGRSYLRYARKHSLQYRLMFGTPLPDPRRHPEMMRSAQHAFSLLRECLLQIRHAEGCPAESNGITEDALFVWAVMHGFATVLETDALRTLDLPSEVLKGASDHLLERIGQALSRPVSAADEPRENMNT